MRTQPNNLMKKITAGFLAILLLMSLIPCSVFISSAEPTYKMDGTFESYNLNASPEGWSMVSFDDFKGEKYSADTQKFAKYYVLSVSDQKFVGNKALCISANDGVNKGTYGYAAAQSPAISVKGNKEYIFDYTIKTVVQDNVSEFRGGLVFVCEYNSKGELINRKQIGTRMDANKGWTSYSVSYSTQKDTTTVKVEFFLGGTRNKNYGAKFLIDEVSFASLPDDKLLNGGFEETKLTGDLYSWYLRPCTNINNDSTAAEFVKNHELKIVDGYHGKAAQIVKKGSGYVTLTSNMIKTTVNTTYVIDYALKVANCNSETFIGARLDIAEFDENQKLIGRIKTQGSSKLTDWKEISTTYTPSEKTKYFRIELYCGDHQMKNTFTVLFDDVMVTPFERENAKNNIHNGNFEDVHEGTIFDWTFTAVNGTKYSSSFDGYNGTKGLYIQRKTDDKGHALITSNRFEVKPDEKFKATYMIRLDNFVDENYATYSVLYAAFYDKDGKSIKTERINEADYYPTSIDWSRRQSYHTVPENAVSCEIRIRVNGFGYDCWIDDVNLTYLKDGEKNYGFNETDVNGEILGWTPSNPAAVKLDDKVYREGTGSLFISQNVDKNVTYIVSDTLIPVDENVRYELSVYIKSYGCDISADGFVMNARTYDKNGKFLGNGSTISGRHTTLNNDSTPSNWRKVVCGVTGNSRVAYVRPVITIPYGEVNIWIDDFEWKVFDLSDEYYEDFNAVRNDGVPDGWSQTVEEGNPKFETYNSIASITAEDDDDIGIFSTRWDTKMEYTPMKFAINYATKGDTEAKVAIKFFGFNDKEIEEDRIVKELDSTDCDFNKYEFDFVLLTAKYMRIEISNTDEGMLLIEDLCVTIIEDNESKSEDEIGWRGYWVWHDENYKDSINGTPRYFRYHFTVSGTPIASSLQITADDRLKVWINGVEYHDEGMDSRFTEVSALDGIHESIREGDNVLAVEVVNHTAYAGLIFDGFIETEDGKTYDFYSTEHIVSTKVFEEGWFEQDFDDSSWGNAKFMDYNANDIWPEDLVYDKSPYIKDKFEVIDYTLSESVIAGDDATLTVTLVPEVDFTKNIDLMGNLWIRNSQNKVLSLSISQISGPEMKDWKEGEQVTIGLSFNIPDFVASGRYIIQLDTNQVVVTNYDIFNNKFVKAINVTNNSANQSIKAELVNVNGTTAVSINGKVQPFHLYNKLNSDFADKSKTTQYMHDAGICITRIATNIGKDSDSATLKAWQDIDTYDWSLLDSIIYNELSLHPDTYLMPSVRLSVREWWIEQNSDQLVVDSNGKSYDLTMFSESGIETALKANLDMIEHMMSQPYWNRIIAFNLVGFADTEFIWYGSAPQYTIDYSEPAQTYFKKWLENKYGTDAELQKAWNNNKVTLKTASVPAYEEHFNDKYNSIYDPEVNAAARDFAECMEEREIEIVKKFYAAVTEKVDDSRFLGSYFGYLYTRIFYQDAIRTAHTKIDEFLDDPNLDFLCAPATYTERFDGEAAAMNQMIDGVLRKGKAVLIEDDYRACAYINLGKNFYTRDSVGTTYNMNDSISALIKNQAISLTQGASLWYYDIVGNLFEREQFSRIIEICQGEKFIDLSREKSYTGDVAYIMDEDGYEQYGADQTAIRDASYEMIFEQKYDLARAGIMVDYYTMSDLIDGIVPDYKVYVMINTIEIDDVEKEAINKNLKNNGKIVLWQWLAGASDRKEISAKNMSEIIGMDVEFNTSKLILKSIISNKEHWLIDGVQGKSIGSGSGAREVSPIAIVTDNDANVTKLGHLYDSEAYTSLAVMENENWTSIFSSVPGYNVKMIKNVLKKAGVHMYSDNLNDVIYANTNYVGINAAYGGEKTIKLDGTYAVYDVIGQTTYSTSTDVINFTMEDNQTKLFRLMPVNTNIIYVNTMYQGTLEGEAYNEVMTGDDFEAKITADDGYVIAQIITDTERKTINRSSYTVEFDDVDNSHYVRVIFAPEGSVEGGESNLLLYILIGAGVLLVAAAAVFFVIFLKKKKEKEVAEDAE